MFTVFIPKYICGPYDSKRNALSKFAGNISLGIKEEIMHHDQRIELTNEANFIVKWFSVMRNVRF